MKSGRQDKEKEAKKMSRHMEEKEQKRSQEDKQRINMLVKRVKELEAKVGKGVVCKLGYYILVKSSNRPQVFLPIFGKAIRTISMSFAIPNRPAYQPLKTENG